MRSTVSRIESSEELRKLRLADEGYIVIKDIARPPIVHKINAKCVSVDNFNEKVMLNEGKTGGYFWVDSIESASHLFGATRCKVCKPELKYG